MKYRRLRPLPATGRLALSLVCAVASVLAAGLAFMAEAGALGATACGTAAISLALSAVQWRSMRAARTAEEPDEVTIDLCNPIPRLSTNDPVTGLVDKTFFRVTLSQRVASARRHLQPLSLVVFELDGFERARPERRDQALRLLGSALRRTLRECDTACRYGDAAVAALLEDTPESGAAAAAERVRKALAMSPTGRSFTLSAGIACYPSHALDAHDLLRRSVQALAAARAAGRDRVEIAGVD
ncbi:MAG TPA: GGDEF domain-containing protein [Acidimicrobiia bacterium]|nr:GGDEF domain-containing protein [Acidimicrobiia bacterium]